MATADERQQILNMIADGSITAEQGAELLSAMSDDDGAAQPIEPMTPLPTIDRPKPDNWWWILFWIGAAVLIGGAFMLAPAYQSGGAMWLLLVCGWPTFLVGLLIIIAAWLSRNGPWVHIRIRHDDKTRRNINFSVPLNLSTGVLKIVTPFAPRLKETGVGDMLIAMKDNVSRDQPLVIDVNEEDDGEHIQVIVG